MKMISNANLLEKSLHKIFFFFKKKHNLVVLRDIFEELSCAVLTIMN